MKKMSLLLLSVMTGLSLFAQTVTFSPAKPELGTLIKFVYDPKGGNLQNFEHVSGVVKALSDRDELVNIPVKLSKEGSVYHGEFRPKDSTHLAVLIFSAGGNKDENPNGHFIKFYKNGVPTPMSLFLEGHLYGGFGNRLNKMKVDFAMALAAYQLAFKADPLLKDKYFGSDLSAQYMVDQVKGEKQIREAIAYYNTVEVSEKVLRRIASLYTIIKDKTAADSVYNLVKNNYPKGAYVLSVELNSIRSIKGGANKEKKLNEIVKEFNLDLEKKADLAKVSPTFVGIGIAFLATEDYEKVEYYIDREPSKTMRALFYNSFAWNNERIKGNLPFFAKISKKSLDLIESAMQDEEPAAYYNSKEEYMKVLHNSYIQYQVTYAVILDLLGKSAEALAVMTDAVNKDQFSSSDMNARYVILLAKNEKNEQAISYAERFVRAGQDNPRLKNELKSLYKGTLSFEVYYASLVKEADVQGRENLLKEMINIPAPKFSLTNLKGEKTDLEKLKGKVVVLDYWATWCGPCLLSFPGMQMAVDKYKDDPKVVFLFINTWERGEGREKALNDWVKANSKYNFNVLLDAMSADGLENYEVVDLYKVSGLPTKFVIDADGNIRFKKIGFDGTTAGVVKELDMMIQMAKSKEKLTTH